ncbi:MAG: hypothetical protein WAM82_29465 [Thermoanaerobaculia bacterium]
MEPLEPSPATPPAPVPPSAPEAVVPPPPPDLQEGRYPTSDSGNLGGRIEQILGRTVNVAETVNQYDVSIFGRENSRPQELSPRHFQVWDQQQLASFADEAVYDDGEVGRLEEILFERRLLVITGEEEMGKGALALFLAARIRSDVGCNEVLYSPGLGDDVAVSLDRLSEKGGRCAGRLLIFRDAFASQNEGLLSIPRELDASQLGRLQQRLEASGTLLILTSDRARLPGADSEPRLRSLGILGEVQGPGRDLLLRDLHRRAERLGLERGARDEVSRVVIEHDRRIVDELRTVPRIDRFVRFYLMEVATADLPLEEAIGRVRNRETWLLSELSKDPEIWALALALVLAQPLPSPDGVPWYPFYLLWREIVAHFRKELRLAREPRESESLIVGRELLERVRARVRRVSPGTDMVQFQSSVDPAALWEALLGPGRSLASSMVPLLQRLAKDGGFAVRETAARALGRIGRVDPLNLVFPLLHQWSEPDAPNRHSAALGHMLQGIFGGRDPEYRELCLRQLRYTSLWRSGKDVWPGAVALREIGRLDLALAVRELVDILGRGLRDRPGHVSRLDREFLRDYEKQRRSEEKEEGHAREEDRIREALKLVTPVMFSGEEELHALAAVQFSLVGLCLSGSPIRVLVELGRRLRERAEGKLLPLFTLLFLRTGGIADLLERNKTSVPVAEAEEGKAAVTVSINDLLFFASFEDGAMERLFEVLATVFRGTDEFPGLIARNFKAKFALLLKSLARDAVQIPDVQNTCAVLFASLLGSEDRDLKEMVFQMLKRDADFMKEGSKMAELARQALIPQKPYRTLPAA